MVELDTKALMDAMLSDYKWKMFCDEALSPIISRLQQLLEEYNNELN